MLIGLTGPSGSYKTQVAKHLERAHGFDRLHAGAPAKAAIRAASGMTRKEVRASKKRATMRLAGANTRELHEAVSEAMHAAAPELTAMRLQRRVAKCMGKGKNCVVDGVRSPLEAATLQRMGGMIVRADNGKPADPAKPMDRMQATVKECYTIDTSAGKKARRGAVDSMVNDLRNCNT